ncbi:hypothetical protein PVK06_001845 [Gossypium arboreum]|uniref:DUF4283 domain-containing protein n=1 Tax=Gossypium arboreum TaxID=29729 RepID=A0ABR0R2D5_GOSAR|nr:hypothetical protein PVK06_001845 [Gossypium arboreum]
MTKLARKADAIAFDEDDELAFVEGDIMRSFVNGILSINFSEKDNQLLIKDMAYIVVIKILGRRIGFAVLQNKVYALWKPIQPFKLMDISNGYFVIPYFIR